MVDKSIEGLDIDEACFIAGIGRTKIYEALGSGKLIGRKLGKRRIILRSDLMNFLNNLPVIQPDEVVNLNDSIEEGN